MDNKGFLGISRTSSSNINQTIVEVGTSKTVTKWKLMKNTSGKYGIFCLLIGGSLQVPSGSDQSQIGPCLGLDN